MKDANPAALAASEAGGLVGTGYWRQATDVANLCREIVTKTALEIGDRKHVRVEGWSSIAVAHGCIPSVKLVEETEKGIRAVAELKRQSDGHVLATAEGFVGKDEPDWYGGQVTRWSKKHNKEMTYNVEKRADFAIRAMAQTRAVSRVCRAGFSHVVVLIDENLSTVPAEEMSAPEQQVEREPEGGFHGQPTGAQTGGPAGAATAAKPAEVPRDPWIPLRPQFEGKKWQAVAFHFGQKKGIKLGDLEAKDLRWWVDNWTPKAYGRTGIKEDDLLLRAALDVAGLEGLE